VYKSRKEFYNVHHITFYYSTEECVNSLYLIMILEIKGKVTKEQIQQAIEQMRQKTGRVGLRAHFGKLKRGIDGLEYQHLLRRGWN
ncbi:MAG TPA: hypothetical protein VFE53_25510, partial [Mucilaginibacter sp.]|nr:hypothetical protein [Mucilaginibacter sp.]